MMLYPEILFRLKLKMSNILQILGLNPVNPYHYAAGYLSGYEEGKCPTLLYGVELEIERAYDYKKWQVPGMVVTEDGSLRNDGKEFITSPMTYKNLSYCLDSFFTKAKLSDENYSERCSIHVHTNCQDLTFDELITLLMIYQVFERVLYEWIGHDRDKNIFCVPWHQTLYTSSMLATKDIGKFKNWQKYTGLNLLPLFSQGTIEWRHMDGHCDYKRLMLWCTLIGCMYNFAKTCSLKEAQQEILSLNTNSLYEVFSYKVFNEYGDVLMKTANYRENLEEGVLDVKYALLNKSVKENNTYYDDFIVNEQQRVRDAVDHLRRLQEQNRLAAQQRAVDPLVREPLDRVPARPVGRAIPRPANVRAVLDEAPPIPWPNPFNRERNV